MKPVSHTALPTVVPDPPCIQHATPAGERALWVVFVIMLVSTIIFIGLAYRVPVQKRLFHILTAFITTFATISYFAMATGDGVSLSHSLIKHKHSNGFPDLHTDHYRAIYYARYVDWSITTPLLLLDLAFLAGLNGADMLVAVVADLVMILTGLFAGYGANGAQKWGYYTIACLAYLVIIYEIAVGGRRTVASKDKKTAAFFASLGGFTLILWTIYPIVWGLGEGAFKISVDTEIMIYAVLDILAKPVFGFWLLITHDRLPASQISLDGAWAHGFGKREGSLRVGDDDA
ncbi:MAG: hypothetical protein M1814_006402 [Vezdaea aestivalis]|nr:MAG: hypothetical protein M1814_006402 [Vezdaea aestivalis]